jgi:hypothetical protein
MARRRRGPGGPCRPMHSACTANKRTMTKRDCRSYCTAMAATPVEQVNWTARVQARGRGREEDGLWPWLQARASPVVLVGAVGPAWALPSWSLDALAADAALGGRTVRVRWHPHEPHGRAGPVYETEGLWTTCTVAEACAWARDPARTPPLPPPLPPVPQRWSMYLSYQRLPTLLEPDDPRTATLAWASLGVPPALADGALWLGSEGAGTPCHYDTYGANMVLLLAGRKLWRLFPPSATARLAPTRLPYEESSVFSQLGAVPPDLPHLSVDLERTLVAWSSCGRPGRGG